MNRQLTYELILSGVACLAFLGHGELTHAQSDTSKPARDVRGFFALPMELDFDSGAANGDANILRIMPLFTFPVFERWKLINLAIITLADAPSGTPAFPGNPSTEHTAGLSDLLLASFVTPAGTDNFIWGAGVMLSLPTATSDSLGSEKWTIGPAIRLTYRTEMWNFGMIAGQRWSVAGTGNRDDVSQLLMRGMIRRQLPNDWYFVSAPLITANWNSPGEKWLIPLGGGIGRTFTRGSHPWAWSVQGYYNVVRPDRSPDWVFRFAIITAIPFGEK